jgi:limonene-1,2-epoxide hydrolase
MPHDATHTDADPTDSELTDPTSGSAATASRTPIEVVEAFLHALETFDVEASVALLDPDVVYQNVPFPPARGRDAVAKQLLGFKRFAKAFEVRMHNISADGPVVLTERTDVITIGRVPGAFWVCGTFEVHDGRITLWRDRFDQIDFFTSFVRGGLWALLGRKPPARPNRADPHARGV